MPGLPELSLTHAAWGWAAAGAALLAVEVASGSGWLLWPAAAAGVVAVVEGFTPLPVAAAVLLFAGLTLVSTLTARRYFPRRLASHAHDINDNVARLMGHEARVVAGFEAGAGRVFVDGKEWAAELEPGERAEPGAQVVVTGVAGARLKVRSASQTAR
jgi:membrane protein implicated in regulation of membrane protease activity